LLILRYLSYIYIKNYFLPIIISYCEGFV